MKPEKSRKSGKEAEKHRAPFIGSTFHRCDESGLAHLPAVMAPNDPGGGLWLSPDQPLVLRTWHRNLV